ncbi:MAG: helix-turn-helix transcriptional regulator [Candidatus Heimdallarchaeota archaeon]|nr:helix-turn-helix transcriptional regulator [Candidatus Heimdallarchaeota archaeon]
MTEIKSCPIQVAFYKTSLHKKWTLTIIRDLLLGEKQFSSFLRSNPELSAKVLSQRLKEMQAEDMIVKKVIETTPITVEYQLTAKGAALNKILYELSMYGAKYYTKEVFGESNIESEDVVNIFGGGFMIPEDELDFYKSPTVMKDNIIDIPS